MPLQRDVISNFIGGVSQQTDRLIYPNQSKELLNQWLDPIEGLKRRPPLEYIAKVNDTLSVHPYIHTIIKEDEEYQVLLTGDGIKVYDLEGNGQEVYVSNSSSDYITSSQPLKDLYAVTIADYTFILNKTKTTALLEETKTNPYPYSAIIFVKQGDYSMDYTITINGSTAASLTTSSTDASKIKTNEIASSLASSLSSLSNFSVTRTGSTILLTNTANESFTIQASDSNGDRNLFAFYTETSCLNDLPATAPNGFILKIIGDGTTVVDDYYVEFQTSDGSDFGSGSWVETCSPDIPYKIDPETMPHALIRESDGTFTLDEIDWTERKAGDEDTAATPSFVGNTIQEVLTYKSRLGFVSTDRITFSDTEDIFSFFKHSVQIELDTDPIDVGSNSKMVLLKHSLPFNESLLLFSETSQFNLSGGDSFTNSTVSIDLVSEYQCSKYCKPIITGAYGYFLFENGSFTRIMETYITASYTIDSREITEQVPSYVPANIYKLAGSAANNVILAVSTDELDSIYIYNFYFSNESKVQSAWHKWTFENAKILNIDFNKHLLYLTIQYSDGIYLEKINLTPKLTEENLEHLLYLDRKVYITDTTYDEDENTTTFTMPYEIESDNFKVIKSNGFPLSALIEDNTVTVSGQHTTLIAGNTYNSLWQLPTIYVRTQTQNGGLKVQEGILMLRDINLSYADTGYFKVTVTPEYTTQITSTFKFTGKIEGHKSSTIGKLPVSSGTFLIPVISKNEDITIKIENDGYMPSCFIALEWLGDFTYRGK